MTAPAPPVRQKISPDKQIDNLYNAFKNKEGYKGLRDLLSSNPNLTQQGDEPDRARDSSSFEYGRQLRRL